jgi:hypothetical protein
VSEWHVIAFMLGWLAHLVVGLWHLRGVYRRHESEIGEVRIEERLRAKRLFDEHTTRIDDIAKQRMEWLARPIRRPKP